MNLETTFKFNIVVFLNEIVLLYCFSWINERLDKSNGDFYERLKITWTKC